MFGKMGDMMGKLQQMKQQMEESKERLGSITVKGEAQGITVLATGNRKITDIQLPDELMEDREMLQDALLIAMNRALENAENVWESEMKNAAGGMLPNLGL